MKFEETSIRVETSSHLDFLNEKTQLQSLFNDRGHACIMFHCEINLLTRHRPKRYASAHANYTLNCARLYLKA